MADNIVIPINKTVDISQGTLITTLGLQNTNDQLIQGQSYANVLNVSVKNAGVPVDLSGSCMGYFVRQKDGSTVTVAGTISGNVASVEFPSFAYAYTGRLTITLSVGGTDLVQIATTVRLGSTPVVVDPGNVLPNLDEIQQIMLDVEAALNQLDSTLQAAQQATAAINGLTATANTLPFTSPATATAEIVSGAWKLTIGVPQGVRGSLYYAGTAITGTSTTPTAYATGIEAALAGDLYYYNGTTPIEVGNVYICTTGGDDSTALWSFLGNWRGTSGSGSVSFVDAVSPNADGDVILSAVRYVTQTLQPAQQQQALTNISGVGYVSQTLTDEQQQQARANIGAQASLVHNYAYDGADLSKRFTAAELHQKVSSGDFSGIQNGDYWPITLTGSFKDYASGQTKTLNNALFKLEANINVYINYGDTPLANHIVFCSRDLIPLTLQMRSANTVWYDDSQSNPWLGSALYQTLNAADGVLGLVSNTDIGAYMYGGPNGNGMRFLLETKRPEESVATSWKWGDRGKLFLPTEREVWGQDVWSEPVYGSGGCIQWPLFATTERHVIKRLVDGGNTQNWWTQSSQAQNSENFAYVSRTGDPTFTNADSTALGVPLCFIIV